MKAVQIPLVVLLLTTVQATLVKALDSRGAPIAGVKVFDVGGGPEFIFTDNSKDTDQSGTTQVLEPSMLIGLAPDGRLAITRGSVLNFGRVGDLPVRLTDERGRPLASRYIAVLPGDSGEKLKNVGEFFPQEPGFGYLERRLSGLTDAAGLMTFHNLPLGVPFAVITRLPSKKVIRFIGSFEPGRPYTMVVTQRSQLTGRIVDQKGRPVSGASVTLSYTPYLIGPLDLKPTVLFWSKTDQRGFYHMSRVANCEYIIDADGAGIDKVQAMRTDGGKWQPIEDVDVSPGRTVCDLRVTTSRHHRED